MKAIQKRSLIIVCIVVFLGIASIFLWRLMQFKQDFLSQSDNASQIALAGSQQKSSVSSKLNSSNNHAIQLSNSQSLNTEKKEQINEAVKYIDSLGNATQAESEAKKETPAELLQRYFKLTNSPEFLAELRTVIEPIETGIYSKYVPKETELDAKVKELEQELSKAEGENYSKIQAKLDDAKSELWEWRVEYFEEVTLMADESHKVLLRYMTNEEIRIAREEMWKTMPSPVGNIVRDERWEIVKKAGAEAMRRLKAKGWVPANPDERYY